MDHDAPDSLAEDAAAASAALEGYLMGQLALEHAVVALERVEGRASFDFAVDGVPADASDSAILARYETLARRLGWPSARAR